MRLSYPSNVKIIQVPCSGRVDILHLLRAIEDGADGVYVAGDYLYASTGHHSKHRGAYAKDGDQGYGAGHGLEVFSLCEPGRPRFLGRTKFPRY